MYENYIINHIHHLLFNLKCKFLLITVIKKCNTIICVCIIVEKYRQNILFEYAHNQIISLILRLRE